MFNSVWFRLWNRSNFRARMIKIVNKRWGKEEWIINDEYCGKILTIKKGISTSTHYHKLKKETMFVLNGCVKIEWYPFQDYIKRKRLVCSVILSKFQSFTLFPMTVHRITGMFEMNKVMEISAHHEDSDVCRIRER